MYLRTLGKFDILYLGSWLEVLITMDKQRKKRQIEAYFLSWGGRTLIDYEDIDSDLSKCLIERIYPLVKEHGIKPKAALEGGSLAEFVYIGWLGYFLIYLVFIDPAAIYYRVFLGGQKVGISGWFWLNRQAFNNTIRWYHATITEILKNTKKIRDYVSQNYADLEHLWTDDIKVLLKEYGLNDPKLNNVNPEDILPRSFPTLYCCMTNYYMQGDSGAFNWDARISSLELFSRVDSTICYAFEEYHESVSA